MRRLLSHSTKFQDAEKKILWERPPNQMTAYIRLQPNSRLHLERPEASIRLREHGLQGTLPVTITKESFDKRVNSPSLSCASPKTTQA